MALTAGLVCAVCGAHVDIAEPLSWVCPNTSPSDRRHALAFVPNDAPAQRGNSENPFLAFRPSLAWDSFASANGMSTPARDALVRELDAQLVATSGTGFTITPFARSAALSDALGFGATGGVWVKDETGQVAGSHKARHLFTILLHLRTAELLRLAPWVGTAQRPPLAIASCGNAAIAAATLGAALSWPIEVYVPPSADRAVVTVLAGLGARVVTCPRVADDPPGDPCVHRFRDAVALGAVPFTVQGTENAWCLDGGRTIGWEMGSQFADACGGARLDRVVVQVGGGALAAGTAAGLAAAGQAAFWVSTLVGSVSRQAK